MWVVGGFYYVYNLLERETRLSMKFCELLEDFTMYHIWSIKSLRLCLVIRKYQKRIIIIIIIPYVILRKFEEKYKLKKKNDK